MLHIPTAPTEKVSSNSLSSFETSKHELFSEQDFALVMAADPLDSAERFPPPRSIVGLVVPLDALLDGLPVASARS